MKQLDRILWAGLGIIACLGIFPAPARADTITATSNEFVTKDSYTEESSPTSNYGGQDSLVFGAHGGWVEAFFFFSFHDRPATWFKAELNIEMDYVSATTNVSVSVVTGDWSEYSITWANTPSRGEVVATFMVAEEREYTVNITAVAGGSNLSLCLNASDALQTGYIRTFSREEDYVLWNIPRIVWTCTSEGISGSPPGWVVLASIAGAIYATSRKRGQQKGVNK